MRLTYRSVIEDHALEEVFAWHERRGALERLMPQWGHVEILENSGSIRDGSRVVLDVRQGPARFRWELRLTDYELNKQFKNVQVSGPLKSWEHTERFARCDGGGTLVEDEIELHPPLGAAGAAIGPKFVKNELARLFAFRYRRLHTDLARHAVFGDRERLTVAITGASGLVGSSLRHFLTTGGHRVIPVVRDRRKLGDDGIFWNPATGEIDKNGLAQADAVVHLAGASIADGRWTDSRKKIIRESRVRGTDLLARTLAEMGDGPRTLISASAVGYYGDRGDQRIDEDCKPGKGFLADVVQDWEAATRPAESAGVRVVRLRMGVVISPAGGALGQMLLPFKIGVGGRLGSGRQYFSWVDLDDVVGAIVHCLMTPALSGPVNVTGPNPVTNATFTSVFGRVLSRPTVLPVPSLAVRALFGQLGQEALLWGRRVFPTKLEESGFRFFYEGIEDSLRFQLGRARAG